MPTQSAKSMIGKRFGRFVVQSGSRFKNGDFGWLCLCDCGNTRIVDTYKLRSGIAQSCGCYRSEYARQRATTHNMHKVSEYKIWNQIKFRTTNPKCSSFKYYGGKGIKMCKRWMKSFPSFLSDMGMRPSKLHSIDRIDGNQDYKPSNCRWATKLQQRLNRS